MGGCPTRRRLRCDGRYSSGPSCAPHALAERLLKPSDRRGRARWRGLTWAQGGLAFVVLALAAAIVLVPSLLARRPAPTLVRAPTAAELIDAAIHRFDRAPLQAGVLHEQYRVQVGGEQ